MSLIQIQTKDDNFIIAPRSIFPNSPYVLDFSNFSCDIVTSYVIYLLEDHIECKNRDKLREALNLALHLKDKMFYFYVAYLLTGRYKIEGTFSEFMQERIINIINKSFPGKRKDIIIHKLKNYKMSRHQIEIITCNMKEFMQHIDKEYNLRCPVILQRTHH